MRQIRSSEQCLKSRRYCHGFLLTEFAISLPPLALFLTVGLGLHIWVNILRTILGFIPGMIHTLRIIVKKKENQDCFISDKYFNYQH